MSSITAASITFSTLAKLPNNHQISGRNSIVVNVGWSWSSFPSLKTSRCRVSCTAKPETVDKVYEVVKKQLALRPETQLSPATKFTELGADSLDTVEIVMGLEEQFDISVEEENAESITTIQEAADVIEKLVAAKTDKS
ncbi:transfer/carrier protein [Lithospermum erythrorhizon]|uniref:Acyl carrier protein n=1 Tax=Lithospermum erythrorhizon TaxID=34254 RepID=A0AAV3R9S7_LITER